MSVGIQVTIEGEHQLDVELLTAAQGIADWRQPLGEISGELLKTFDTNFALRGGLFGGWAPRKKAAPWPLLEKTGQMRRGFRSQQQGNDTLVIDNTAPYFPYHQSNQPRTRLPRRVMMKLDETRRAFIIKAFQKHIVDVVRGR